MAHHCYRMLLESNLYANKIYMIEPSLINVDFILLKGEVIAYDGTVMHIDIVLELDLLQ